MTAPGDGEPGDEVLAAIHQATAAMLQSVMAHDPTAVALAAVGIAASIGERVPDPTLRAVIVRALEDASGRMRDLPPPQ
jgi:hypothetical protein